MKPTAFLISKIFGKRIEMSDVFTAPETNSHQVRNWSIMADFQTFDCFLCTKSKMDLNQIWQGLSYKILSFLASRFHYKHNFQSLWDVMEITMFISVVKEVKADKFRLITLSKNIIKISPK